MTDHIDEDDSTIRRSGLHTGTVADNKDEDGLGRVRVEIPNVHEPMGPWAWPLGGSYGPNRSIWFPFEKGAEVGVFFKEDDPDHPYVVAGYFGDGTPDGKPDSPSPVRNLSPDESLEVAAVEFGNYIIVIDNRPGKKGLILQEKRSGDRIEHDGEKHSWVVKGTSAVIIQADGQIVLDAPLITIGGRPVGPGPEPIQ